MSDDHAQRSEPTLVVGVLGRIRATSGGQELDLGGPRQRALLAALAVDVGRTVPTDTLIDAVWDGDPPEAADRTFRSYVSRLRKALGRTGVDGAEIVHTDAAGYRLDEHLAAVDARLFEAEVAEARQHLAAGQAAVAAGQLAGALDRWEGQALGAFADRVWAAPTSVRLEEQRLAAEELRVRALLDADRTADAVTDVEELAATEPLRESVARLHALALYRAGRDADALRTAREFRGRLADEHGLDPSPRFGELESMILERDPRLDRSVGGQRLRGYVLHEPIARSPLGTVHRAEQPSIGREVAVTVLPPERADDPELVRAFEARVQAVAGLEHPHVLPVYDYWREPGGAYVVTRFPAGGTLDQRLRTGALEVDQALRVGEQVAGALAAAHEAGIVHGELGADAVVVDERGDAFVWAFSLSGDAHASADVAGLATLVADAVADRSSSGGSRVVTAQLPSPVAEAVRRATSPTDDEVVTAAALAGAFAAGRVGADDVPVAPVPTGPNPYRGLAAFRETDADVFFGRDALVVQLLAGVARTRAVAVVGPSGSGKSSVVRAGVLPQLRAEGAFVTTMVPGTRPLAELEVALSRVAAVELHGVADEVAATPAGLGRVVRRLLPGADGELVLVVDQFEELFTLAEPTERDLLLQALLAVVEDPNAPVRVVATVRADFLGQVLSHATAGPLVRDRSVMVTPLTDDELHQVVVGPAEVAGVAVEPALATALVADASRSPGSLPMVQFALTEVFEAAEDGTMELDAYRRIGGIEGVLGQRAEEVFAGLADAGQRAAHQLFQRLVVPNADGPPTRRRASRVELAHVEDAVIEAFGRARLLRFDHDQETREPTVEVTHEALFRAWHRLVAWIEEGQDDLRVLGHLTVAAGDWNARGRADADLYRGNRLDAALAFAADRRDELSDTEAAFLDASAARRSRQAEDDRRTVRRLRVLTAGLAVGLVLALVAGTLAMTAQRREAATAEAAQADALAFAASSFVDEDLELAALLAAEAHAVAPDAGSFGALVDVVADDPRVRRVVPVDGPCPTVSGGSGDLVTVARQEGDGWVAEVRTAELDPVAQIPLVGEPGCPVIDPTGTWLLAGELGTDALRVIELSSGEVVTEQPGWVFQGGPDVDFHPTRPEVVVADDAGRVRRLALPGLESVASVDVAAGRQLFSVVARYDERGDRVVAQLFPEGPSIVAVIDPGGAVTELGPLPGPPQGPAALASRHDLVVATTIDTVLTAPVEPGAAFTPVVTRGAPVALATVSPDGDRFVVGTTAGLELIDLETLRLDGDPVGVDALVGFVRWREADGLRLVTPAAVTTIDLDRVIPTGVDLRVAPPAQIGTWPASDGSGAIVLDGPTWSWVDTATGESVVLARDAQTSSLGVVALPGRRWAVLDPPGGTFEIHSPDGLVAATTLPDPLPVGSYAKNVLLFVEHGVAMVGIDQRDDDPTDREFRLVAFDVEDGSLVADLRFVVGLDSAPTAYRPLPDGRFVLGYESGRLEVVAADGTVHATRELGAVGPPTVGGDRDGSRVAHASPDEIVVYDVDLDQELARLTGLPSGVGRLSFAADDLLLTRHFDGSTLLWDLQESVLIGAVLDLGAYFRFGYALTEDGRGVVHATPTGLARIPLDEDSWLAAACELVARPLSRAELEAVAPGRVPLDPCGFGDDASVAAAP